MTQRLHYTMCGLDNIYLVNGFRHVDTSRGKRLHIDDQDGLHKAIATFLVQAQRGLTGKELRFLREELDLSQTNLARMLGESEQTVARREKKEKPFKRPTAQERVIRFLYEENIIGNNEKLRDYLQRLAEMDEFASRDVEFAPDQEGKWQQAAA